MSFKIVWESYKAGKRTFSEAWTTGAKAYLRGSYAGKPHFESLKTGDRLEASRAFALRQAEIIKTHEAAKGMPLRASNASFASQSTRLCLS